VSRYPVGILRQGGREDHLTAEDFCGDRFLAGWRLGDLDERLNDLDERLMRSMRGP